MCVKDDIVGISDNVLQEYVAGVHKIKSMKVGSHARSPTINFAVSDTKDAPVWIHHEQYLFESLLVGNRHCDSERSIIVEVYEDIWMDSRSKDG